MKEENSCPKCNSKNVSVSINPLNNKCICRDCGKKYKLKD